MTLLFWGSIFIIIYIYAGYPALVYLLSGINHRGIKKGGYQPFISILIAAHNEEKNIGMTIRNKLDLDYPEEKKEIIVISDGSTDKTDDIVKEHVNAGVKLIRQEPRMGKTAALNSGVREAKGEILVFSDANSIYDPGALNYLMQNFNDPEIGYVTGKMIYTNEEGAVVGDGCSAYMKYENYLRKVETDLHSIVGVDGGIDAARRKLYQPMEPYELPDFILPLKVVEQGYRVVYEPMAVLKEPTLNSSKDEYKMRVRVSLRALWALSDMKHLLNIKKYCIFAWELLSHKILRYLAFIFLITLYVSNIFLWNENLYFKVFFIMQNIFYTAALLSFVLEKLDRRVRMLYVPYYFSLINIASAHAFIKFILRRKQVVWTPRKGT